MTNLIKLHDFCFICRDIKVVPSLPLAAGLAKARKAGAGKAAFGPFPGWASASVHAQGWGGGVFQVEVPQAVISLTSRKFRYQQK